MASKRRNMFCENKKEQTTEIAVIHYAAGGNKVVMGVVVGVGRLRVGRRGGANMLFMLVLLSCSVSAADRDDTLIDQTPSPHKNCLGEKAVYPRKYMSYNGSIQRLVLGTSSRVTQQLATHLGYIFLREVLGYPDVDIFFDTQVRRQYFNNTNVLTRLTHMDGIRIALEKNQTLKTCFGAWTPSSA
ncbi:hypothetical protein AAG570_001732 [Ranatra chinensis]|uniref:Uncharacterized protein n=1 Tax=Ranatra chinensis TaxID=642074 RepID=A0ABD0Y9M3_9HEMI